MMNHPADAPSYQGPGPAGPDAAPGETVAIEARAPAVFAFVAATWVLVVAWKVVRLLLY